MQFRASQHKVCGGLANLGAVHQNFDVRRFCVVSTFLQTVACGVQTDALAVQAVLNTLCHVLTNLSERDLMSGHRVFTSDSMHGVHEIALAITVSKANCDRVSLPIGRQFLTCNRAPFHAYFMFLCWIECRESDRYDSGDEFESVQPVALQA